MNNIEVLEQIPAENQQQFQETNEDKEHSENNCYISEKVINFENKSKNLLSDSKTNSLFLSLEKKKLKKHDNMCTEIDDNFSVLSNEKNDLVVEERFKNNVTNNDETNLNKKFQNPRHENIKSQEYLQLLYDWNKPILICSSVKEFKPTNTNENFTKGCFWSPDGTCILVPGEDFKIRIFELPRELYSGKLPKNFNKPSFESLLQVKEGGLVYDSCWFPYMNSWDPSTCCFLSTSQGSPIHLWDAFTGQLRATYRAYNHVDEVEAAISVQFIDSGGQIWSGFKNALRIFETNRPGRQINTIYLKKDFPNVTGLVSCIRENPGMAGLIAFGTYSKHIGLYKDGPLCSFVTGNGVTQIEFSPCGTKLYSSVRRGSEFLCWDLRNPGTVLYSLGNRQSDTNQRIYFSLSYNAKEIVSGGTDGAVRIWQIPDNLQIDEDLYAHYKIQISNDCINGVNLHKNLPVLAVCTGSRIYDEENRCRDNSVRFYWLGNR